jgi:sugar/nucleoside kinase (ribokinase family)
LSSELTKRAKSITIAAYMAHDSTLQGAQRSTARFDVLAVGELNVDLILDGAGDLQYGQAEHLIDDATLVLGSSTAIFACGAARLGLRVAFVGVVGADMLGQFVLRELRAHNIDVSGVIVDPALKTGMTVIFKRAADRAMLTYPGSIPALTYAQIDMAVLAQARHLHLGAFFMLDGLRPQAATLFQQARAAGLTTSLDTNFDPRERWDNGLRTLLPLVDVFLPNESELCAIAGLRDPHAAARTLAASYGARMIAVKQGADGAFALAAGQMERAAPLIVNVVDTVGAGDTFDAGMVYGILAGWDVARALRMGCVCGSLSARAAGGTAAQPDLAEAMRFL